MNSRQVRSTTLRVAAISLLSLTILSFWSSNSTAQNLISNSTFELGAVPSFQGWHSNTSPSFSNDTPPGGGSWSLKLQPEWVPAEGYAEHYLTGVSGTKIFEFSSWMKVVNGFGHKGYVCLYLMNQPHSLNTTCTGDSTSAWKQVFYVDTFSLQPSDTLVARLSAGSTEVAVWDVLFDNVQLIITGEIPNGYSETTDQHGILIYPNPCDGHISVQIVGFNTRDIEVWDAYGRLLLVSSNFLSTNRIDLDLSSYPTGIYFIRKFTPAGVENQRLSLIK